MLDELMLGGEVQETSKKNVLKAIAAQDLLQEVSNDDHPIPLWNTQISGISIISLIKKSKILFLNLDSQFNFSH